METLSTIVQVVIALGVLNVWIVRFGKPTSWRGGNAENMQEEFAAYGLPFWALPLVGSLKVFLAVLLIVGIWIPEVIRPAALAMAVLMLGAISMHIKVKDPLRKSLPALMMLLLSIIVVLI